MFFFALIENDEAEPLRRKKTRALLKFFLFFPNKTSNKLLSFYFLSPDGVPRVAPSVVDGGDWPKEAFGEAEEGSDAAAIDRRRRRRRPRRRGRRRPRRRGRGGGRRRPRRRKGRGRGRRRGRGTRREPSSPHLFSPSLLLRCLFFSFSCFLRDRFDEHHPIGDGDSPRSDADRRGRAGEEERRGRRGDCSGDLLRRGGR